MNVSGADHGLAVRIGIAQLIAWASSQYLPGVIAVPMAEALGMPVAWVFGGLSGALVLSALAGPLAGRLIDHFGGRPVLVCSNLLFAAGLLSLAVADGLMGFVFGWGLIGIAMAAGLYDGAFAALVRLRGTQARPAITVVTLIAGFASTIGWPLTAWIAHSADWRVACLGWALLHLIVAMPLYASLPAVSSETAEAQGRMRASGLEETGKSGPRAQASGRASLMMALLATMFALSLFVTTAMAAHLPGLLVSAGLSLPLAIAGAALVGPAQVLGRLIEFTLLRRASVFLLAALAVLAHPVGAVALLLQGEALAYIFAALHGLGNGLLTIVKGTLPLTLFGAAGYGRRVGLIMLPAKLSQALAPLLFGIALEHYGVSALWLTTALCALSALVLMEVSRMTSIDDGHRDT